MCLINVDLRHYDTGLTPREKREAIEECQRLKQIQALSGRWVLHPSHSPKRGSYNPLTGAPLESQ
ncbi:hypothetical protein [Paraburkholderia tropica]|uniref:hypothetical protein n=1 Tax=Paraburkholderia tropica TaxID=92647 RepID=UPI002AB77D5D|nr:hypothetical protein [Paraburkholderia tropica]